MKRRKIAKAAVAVLSIMTIGAAGAALTACDGCDKHVHSYGDWTIVGTKPTLTDGGTAERYCEADDGGVETVTIPNLLDTSVWTEGSKVDSTCSVEGSRTFTSEYGTVTITLPLDPSAHTGGTWTITQDPTDDAKGKASHNCEAEIDIPALSDKSVWTENKSEYVEPTHTKDGKKVYTSVYGTVTVVLPANAGAHSYGDWTFVEGEEPSFEEGGRIQRICGGDSSHIEYHAVPDLNDTDFWTYDIINAPSHLATGLAKYSNSEYDIELDNVVLSKIAHTFGAWVITTEPTEEDGGVATRTCTLAGCKDDESATQTATLPNLKDSAWSKKSFDADYNKPAGTTYTHAIYGSFTVYTGVKLPAPYDNKTYTSVNIRINDNTGAAYVEGTWNTATLTVGADSIGYGTAYPFRGKHVFEFVDPETGLVKITHYNIKSTSSGGDTGDDEDYGYGEYALRAADEYDETADSVYFGYVDVNSGILVLQVKNGWREVTVAVPSETAVVRDNFNASECAGDYIISYLDTNILVTGDGTFFGVSISDLSGNALTAANCLNNATGAIIVKDKAGKLVKAYALNADSEWVAADGLQGTYTLPDDRKVVVNGASSVKVDGVAGAYEIVSLEDRIISVVFGSDYYEYTLSADGLANDATCTEKVPKVTISYDLNGETITNSIELSNEVSKNVAINLAVPQHATKEFVGWYTDAACETPVTLVDGKYIPADNATLYAKWAARVTMHLNNLLDADADKATLYIGEGVNIHSKLDLYTLRQINENKYFDGWYTNAACTEALAESAIAYADDEEMQIYAKWTDINALYGVYSGKQLLAGGYLKEANLNVDVDGTITGTIGDKAIEGKIYYEDDKYTWRANGSDKDNSLWFDSDCLIVVPDDFGSATMSTYPFLLSRDGEVGGVEMFDYTVDRVKLVEYGDKLALVYNNNVYGDITVVNAYGEELSFANVRTSKTLVFKQGNSTVLAIGTTAENFSKGKDEFNNAAVINVLDAHYGVYTVGGVDYKLDGVGNISWNDGKDHSGIYTYVKDDGDDKVFDVYDRERKVETSTGEDEDGDPVTSTTVTYKNVAYYELRLGATNSFTKPVATINFVSSQGTVDPVSANIKIPYTLAVLDNTTTHVFRGWYENSDFSGDAVTEITLNTTDVKTLHARWLEKATLTADYRDGADGASRVETYEYGVGETVKLDSPTREGYKLVGWYTDADWNNEWTDTEITGDLNLYAKWVEAPVYSFINYGNLIANQTDDGAGKGSLWHTCTLKFDENGHTDSGSSYPFSGKAIDVSNFDKENGTLTLTSTGLGGNGIKNGYIDLSTNVIVVTINDFGDTFRNISILVPNCGNSSAVANYGESYWNDGYTRVVAFDCDGTHYAIFVHDSKVYFNVSFKNAAGEDVAAKEAYQSPTLYVRDVNGDLIAKFGYDGTVMNELDGYEDITYTGANGDLTVNGVATITLNGVEGTYTLNKEEGATYTADAYIGDSYYEVTLDKGASTYSIVKRMVNVTFVTDYDAANAVSGEKNKNIAIDLPVLTDADHVFRGWYIDDDTVLLSGEYIPTADVTLTAKWDIKVTLTVVYGNGMENATKVYGAGDVVTLQKPKYKDGKAFDGWYTDEERTIPYTEETISADTTIYCKWIDAVIMYGNYYGWNLYGSSANTISATSTSSTKLLIAADGTVTGTKSGSVSRDNDNKVIFDVETGVFYIKNGTTTYYLVYDEDSGAVGLAYGSSETSFNEDMYLLFNKFIKSGSNSATLGTGGNMTGGKLVSVTFVDDTTVNLFVTSTRIYSGVTWVATNASGDVTEYSAQNVGDAKTLIIRDSKGNIIINRIKDGGTWKDLDGAQGIYTNVDDSFTLNGVGGIVWGDNSGTYKVAPEGSDYTYDVTLSNPKEYYRVTINGNTFTAVKPEATIKFNSAHSTHDDVQANVNISFNLPTVDPEEVGDFKFKGWYDNAEFTGSKITSFTPSSTETVTFYARWIEKVDIVYNMNGHGTVENARAFPEQSFSLPASNTVTDAGWVFKGWYDNAEFTGSAKTSITPTAGQNVNIYAKWVKEVTLTVVYGTASGLENATQTYGAGDKVSLTALKPDQLSAEGKTFAGWFTDATCTLAYTESAINEDMFVYCGWKAPHEMYGSYKGFNYCSSGTGSTGSDKSITNLDKTAKVDADGNVTGTRTTGKIYETTESGVYKINNTKYIYFDASGEIFAESWNTNANLSNDMIIYFRKEVSSLSSSANLTSSGWTGVLTVNYKDGTSTNVLVYNDKIYSGVTWNDGVDALGTKNEETLIVKDSKGNTIVTITGKVATAG